MEENLDESSKSVTISAFFDKMPQKSETQRSNSFMNKMELQIAEMEVERKQTELRISRKLEEMTERASSIGKENGERGESVRLEESRKVLGRHSENTARERVSSSRPKERKMGSSVVRLSSVDKENKGQPLS